MYLLGCLEQVVANDADIPVSWLEKRSQNTDRRCLTGAVRASQAEDLTMRQAQVEVVHRGEITVVHPKIADLER